MRMRGKAVAMSMPMSVALTNHVVERMHERGLVQEAIAAAIEYGRAVYTRGAVIYALGRQEVKRLYRKGLDLARFEGTQVVCSEDGAVITAYRNRDFRGLNRRWRQWRPKKRW